MNRLVHRWTGNSTVEYSGSSLMLANMIIEYILILIEILVAQLDAAVLMSNGPSYDLSKNFLW